MVESTFTCGALKLTSPRYDNCTDPYFSSDLFSQHLSELSTWNLCPYKKKEFTVFKVKAHKKKTSSLLNLIKYDRLTAGGCRNNINHRSAAWTSLWRPSVRRAGPSSDTIMLTQSGWAYKRKLLGEENVYIRHVCYRYFQVLLILAASFEKSNEVTYLYVIFYEIYVSGPEHRY